MALKWPNKDTDEVLDYEIDWSSRLLTDTIQSSTWIVPSGITKNSDSTTSTVTKIWLSGGTTGETYVLTNRVQTAAGRTMDQSVKIKIKDK